MKFEKKAFKNIINNDYLYCVASKVISIILVLAYSIIYNRFMQPELRGIGTVVINYAEIIMLILCLGIYQAYPYFKKRNNQPIFYEFINLVVGLFFVYIIIGGFILLLLRPEAQTAVIIILIPMMFATKQLNYVVLIENPKIRNTSEVGLNVFDIIFVGVLALIFKANLTICLVYLVVRQLVYLLIAFQNLKINIFKLRPSLKKAIPYIKYGIVPMITLIMMEINYKADIIMMERLGVTNFDIGVYSLGITLAQKIWIIPDALKDILLSKLVGGKSEEEVAKISRLSLVVVLIFIVGIAIVGKPFINILYGSDYDSAYTVLLILVIGIIGMVFYKMVYSYNVVNGYKHINLILLGIAAASNVVINALLIPRWGMLGAAVASTCSYFVCGIGFLVFFHRKTNVPYRDVIIIKKEDMKLFKSIFKE